MEHTGLEPVASTLPVWRAPNCANAPKLFYYSIEMRKRKVKIYKIIRRNTRKSIPIFYSVLRNLKELYKNDNNLYIILSHLAYKIKV